MKKPQPSNKSATVAKDGRSSFLEAFKKSPGLAKGLKTLKNAKDENAKPDIVDGTYTARISDVKFGASNGVPYARVYFKIDKGPYRDTVVQRKYDFGKTKPDSPTTEEEIFNRIGVDLERMGAERSDDPQTLLESFEDLKNYPPLLQINVRNSPTGNYLNVYVNRLLEAAQREEEAPADEAEAGDDSVGDEAEGSESEEGDGEVAVEVQDIVNYKPPKARASVQCVVLMSNADTEVCNLKDEKGNIYSSVPWSEVTFVLQEGEE